MGAAIRLLQRTPVIVLLMGAWVTAFMSPAAPWGWLAVPVSMAGILVLRSWSPVIGAAVVLLASGICAVVGVPYAEIEMLLPTMIVLYSLGRRRTEWVTGTAFVVGFAATTALRDGAPPHAVLTAVVVYSSPWVFGRVVRLRAHDAFVAAEESARLASIDLDRAMRETVSMEGIRTTRQSLAVLRRAVERMDALARRAATRFDAGVVDAIRAEGEAAISTLHDILLVLRDPPRRPVRPPDAPGLLPSISLGRIVVAVAGVAVGIAVVVSTAGGQPLLLALAVMMPIAALSAPSRPVLAGSSSAAAMAMTAAGPSVPPDALLPIGLFLMGLMWSLVDRGRLHVLVAVTVGALLLGAQFGRQGVGFVLAITVLATAAAHAWQEKHRIVLTEQTRSARLSAELAAGRRRAENQERDRIARELHDGVSYAVTAMTVQAQAALALAAYDPDGACRCLATARQVGRDALAEIDQILGDWRNLDGVLDGPSVQALVAGARARGQRIRYVGVEMPGDERLIYRVVQESLTNVARYAPGSDVTVETGLDGSSRFVRVVDTGAGGPALPRGGLGIGLNGLAQRVEERGGRFRAAASDEGFEVYAQWPQTPKEAVVDGDG